MTREILLMTCFLAVAHSVESVLGFGATIIAFGLGAHFFTADRLVVMLVLIALLQSAFLVVRWFRHIEWHSVFRFIIPVALAGVFIGIVARNVAGDATLKLILGSFIIILSAVELAVLFFFRGGGSRNLSPVAGFFLVIGGGIFHGLLAIGGPLIVYYAGRKLSSQESVRGTLSFVWIILNMAMLAGFIVNRRVTAEILTDTALLLPGLVLGIIIGHSLKIDEKTFRVITYCMLLGIGVTLVL